MIAPTPAVRGALAEQEDAPPRIVVEKLNAHFARSMRSTTSR